MEWLNYHHLLYFWTVVREGTVSKASERLMLAQPTVTAQIRELERALGHPLFERAGRRLQLTEMGRVVYQYADEIFSLGRELINVVKGRPVERPLQFIVGIDDILPKGMVYRLLEPVLHMPESVHLICREDNMDHLLGALSVGELDMILTDTPMTPAVKIRGYNHLLGESGICVLATRALARKYRRDFPHSLDKAPFLFPMANTSIRRTLDQFFNDRRIEPTIKGEFDDNALLEIFGKQGVGLFPVPSVIAKEVQKQFSLDVVGQMEGVKMQVYAISTERRLKHPAVIALSRTAHEHIFSEDRP